MLRHVRKTVREKGSFNHSIVLDGSQCERYSSQLYFLNFLSNMTQHDEVELQYIGLGYIG